MDCDEEENQNNSRAPAENISGSAVNSLILDYYKKFGRKRDLEQYFSLSTAQSDLKDPSSTFWQRMKSEHDSDSGEKKSDSSQELCRISIKCSVPDPCSSQYHTKPNKVLTGSALLESLGIHVKPMEEDSKTKSESVSPPIIIEDVTHEDGTQNSDDESIKSCDNNSHKSFDVMDTSTNKPLSPSSSITSQRKLEWDSLADVGYGNESDRKTSASSLSTLERLALKQQYSNSDTKLGSIVEPPTAHSTPYDENEAKTKKKGVGKKSTKIYKKDVEYLEVNVPHTSENNPSQSINVNLTKHISFNVEKDGKVTFEAVKKEVSISPEITNAAATSAPSKITLDKEMQTSVTKPINSPEPKNNNIQTQKIPVLISLNTLKRNTRRKKLRMARRKLKSKKKAIKVNVPAQEKSGEPLSEAESFEYMPGHVYNQNQLKANEHSGNTAGNKSSLESSGVLTSDSSKGSKHSFTKDLEKSIDILRLALQRGGNDKTLRKQLIKQLCERLIKSKYRDDESSTEFLSRLSLTNKQQVLGEGNHTTTSTSDNSADISKRPKKSILRNFTFNSEPIASTSQSAPNLPVAANSEKLVSSKLLKNLTSSNTDSDISQKDKSSSDNVFAKTSSQELYQKYLDALKREEAYKRHLKDKKMFLKHKLVCSDSAIKASTRSDPNVNNRLKDLIKDLTRNNYDDGSGDASKLEGGPNSSRDYNDRFIPIRSQRSHSVFTLSSGNSDQYKKQNLQKRLQTNLKDLAEPGTSKEHYCCCPHHSHKSNTAPGVIDSSVQVNIKHPCNDSNCEHKNKSPRPDKDELSRGLAKVVADDTTGDIKYVCLCNNKTIQDVPDNFLIFKCSRLGKGSQEETSSKSTSFCSRNVSPRKTIDPSNIPNLTVQRYDKNARKDIQDKNCKIKATTKSSQTNFLLKMLGRRTSDRSASSSDSKKESPNDLSDGNKNSSPVGSKIYEATRCLQTEISINPRIPEPSLSDINIITDCAKLISEHCREVTKLSISHDFSRQAIGTDAETGTNSGSSRQISKPLVTDVFNRQATETYVKTDRTNSGSSKSSGTSKGIGEMLYDDDNAIGSNNKISLESKEKTESQASNSDRSEKFTIPIQGTNMTLMVSIGSNECKVKTNDMVAQCVGTERNKVTEQATSLTEECSKGVQYDMNRTSINGKNTDYNSNNIGNGNMKMPTNVLNIPLTVRPCLTEDTTFNTYPKTSPVNDRKPLRRANTGTDNFNKCPGPAMGKYGNNEESKSNTDKQRYSENIATVQSDKYFPVQKEFVEKETQYSDKESPKSNNNLLNERKASFLTENFEIQRSNLICSCGCVGDKDKCNKNCEEQEISFDERKKSLSQSSSDKDNCKITTQEKGLGVPESFSRNANRALEERPIKPASENYNECKKNSSKEIGIQKDLTSSASQSPREACRTKSKSPYKKIHQKDDPTVPSTSKNICDGDSNKSDKGKISETETDKESDPILELIQNITKKYSKKDIEKSKRKKCFKEIMAVLNYLLETEDSADRTDERVTSESSITVKKSEKKPEKKSPSFAKKPEKPSTDKSKTKSCIIESSDCPRSTDIPTTSSDSATCKVLNKIKNECERYHQKRCKAHSGKKCDISSSTSASCEQCRRVHHCSCRNHKCKAHKKMTEKIQKKAVAYNLILQTSESISEETVSNEHMRQLQNIVVKVPSQRKYTNVPFKEVSAKIESKMPPCSPREPKPGRSRSLPNESEISSMEDFLRRSQACCTVREYLERNRPDFIAKSSQRQNCLRIISDSRANMRPSQRDVLSVRLAQLSDLNDLDPEQIRQLAKDLGRHMRQKQPAPKLISEREMKKHSENIYKSLPEVVQKKEAIRKENIKKTNLMMAYLFKKNLQKKTLRGSVDISNYSPIIKI